MAESKNTSERSKTLKAAPTRCPVLKLATAQTAVDEQTVKTLSELLEQAKAGRLTGLAYVAVHPDSRYSGDVIGRCRAFPLYTRGVVAALGDLVQSFSRS
jgi:hypothetical protein